MQSAHVCVHSSNIHPSEDPSTFFRVITALTFGSGFPWIITARTFGSGFPWNMFDALVFLLASVRFMATTDKTRNTRRTEFSSPSPRSFLRTLDDTAPTPTTTEMPAEMPVAPTMTEMPADMPVEMPVAPTRTDMPVMAPTKDDSSSSDDGVGSTTITSETLYLPSSDTDTYDDGTGVDSEDVPDDMPGTFEHLGCFKDSKQDRVLTRSKLGSPEMTADVSLYSSLVFFVSLFLFC